MIHDDGERAIPAPAGLAVEIELLKSRPEDLFAVFRVRLSTTGWSDIEPRHVQLDGTRWWISGNMAAIVKRKRLPESPPGDPAVMAVVIEFGDVRPAGLPCQSERNNLSLPQFLQQHVHRLPDSIEPVVIEIDFGTVTAIIEQRKDTSAIRAASRGSATTKAMPGDKEKRDFERIQEVSHGA